jgi:hypothetical protein
MAAEQAYVHKEYPKTLYRADSPDTPDAEVPSKQVANAGEHKALGKDWAESPGEAKTLAGERQERQQAKKPGKPPEPEPPTT